MSISLIHYFDYKSPYAYLAQAATDSLEQRYGLPILRIPYTLDIPSYLGNAQLNAEGRDMVGTRNAHQWRRVRYSYIDCRREANRRGLTIRGPQKIWNTSLAHLGFLYACEAHHFQAYHATVFARFWERALDIEDQAVIRRVLQETGVCADGFDDFVSGRGTSLLETLQREAESAGVFGVPTWRVNDQLFWGSERLPLIEALLENSRPDHAP